MQIHGGSSPFSAKRLNPDNYFQAIEQAAFSPFNMVTGIGPSADIMLQAHRVGPNYQQRPCNAARPKLYSPYQRDGPGTIKGNYGGDPNYVRSAFRPIKQIHSTDVSFNEWHVKVQAFSSQVTDDDFTQPKELSKLFKRDGVDEELVHNLGVHISGAVKPVQDKAVEVWRMRNLAIMNIMRFTTPALRGPG
ncbi:Catalase [Fulvia fulva]|uniref:Catalase n=1 Tax=Passalora fulva TaxID=5499 RepID=A0A9Q8PBA1_PASFU|nr:Catalase [Fulvia fulva]KAK4621923.1 Catalase [Fulvia fulva]KAK4623004.1 Catalase [Fulvia fulva]UJO19288.1 Catalase [Fulvia fulva]WPV15976.1 Catalase [Fulvia fulva]WPV30948.1 Catalase [Fulvia fulva]